MLLAPMALVSGGALAAAVSRAGGLGFLGGGYGDRAWLEEEARQVGGDPGRLRRTRMRRTYCPTGTWNVSRSSSRLRASAARNVW
jgi:nitronate monooxygenase